MSAAAPAVELALAVPAARGGGERRSGGGGGGGGGGGHREQQQQRPLAKTPSAFILSRLSVRSQQAQHNVRARAVADALRSRGSNYGVNKRLAAIVHGIVHGSDPLFTPPGVEEEGEEQEEEEQDGDKHSRRGWTRV